MTQQKLTILQLSLLDETGDSYHRMRWPGRQLSSQAPNWRVINLDFRAAEKFEWGLAADLLVLLHCGDVELLPLLEKRKSLGKKTLIEINDNFYSPQPWNSARKNWDSPLVWKIYERLIQKSDGVIVTSQGLFELLEEKAKGKVFILENHFPFEIKDFPPRTYTDQKRTVNIGWAGSAGHMADLLFITPALHELLKEFPELRIHLMCDSAALNFVRLPSDRIHFVPFGSMQNYFDFWDEVDFGFVPLLETPYNRCRSDIKAVEMAGKGILPILQRGLTYEKFIRETECPSFESLDELKTLVSKYIRDPKKRLQDALRCFEYVKSKRIGSLRRERFELYSRFLNESVSNYPWPMGAGFFEVQGTAQAPSQILSKVQLLWNQNNRSQALQLLREGILSNPFNPELALSELKCLEALKSSDFRKRLNEFKVQFPEDLRFLTIAIRLESQEKEKMILWSELLSKLKGLPAQHLDFFRAHTLMAFKQSHHLDEFFKLAEEILKIFSTHAEFKIILAQELERRSLPEKSAALYKEILEQRESLDENLNFLNQVPRHILEIWKETLAFSDKALKRNARDKSDERGDRLAQ